MAVTTGKKSYITLADLGLERKLPFQPKKPAEALALAILLMEFEEEQARNDGRREWALEARATAAALTQIKQQYVGAA